MTEYLISVVVVAAFVVTAVAALEFLERRLRSQVSSLKKEQARLKAELKELQGQGKAEAVKAADRHNTEWIKQQYHWTRKLNGDVLQYWPTKDKWHWRGVTYTSEDGDTVDQFIERRQKEQV